MYVYNAKQFYDHNHITFRIGIGRKVNDIFFCFQYLHPRFSSSFWSFVHLIFSFSSFLPSLPLVLFLLIPHITTHFCFQSSPETLSRFLPRAIFLPLPPCHGCPIEIFAYSPGKHLLSPSLLLQTTTTHNHLTRTTTASVFTSWRHVLIFY